MNTPIRKLRCAWDEPGQAHFVTYSCYRRLPLLTTARTRRWVIEALESTRTVLEVSLWAYVIMPEHVHVLLRPRRPRYAMRQVLTSLKRPVSVAAKSHLEQTGRSDWLERLTVSYPSRSVFRFWQPGGGFDHNIFHEKTALVVMEYMHANPVRRGLCASPTDWEWSSARFWNGSEDVPLRMDHPHD